MLRSIIVAFSTYSKIPMPRFEWKKEDLRFTMCAFPLVGLVAALVQYGAYMLLSCRDTGYILTAAVMTLIPLLITGGIHMDGYMDTWDALCSYGDKDKKLDILKDPHVGAFAVIHGICYVILTFSLWHELVTALDEGRREPYALLAVLSGYVLSRILSGLFSLTFRKAKKDGMLNDVAGSPDKKEILLLIIMLIAYAACALYFLRPYSFIMLISVLLLSLFYRYMSYSKFGGITGDLAGWFLQAAELLFLLAALTV